MIPLDDVDDRIGGFEEVFIPSLDMTYGDELARMNQGGSWCPIAPDGRITLIVNGFVSSGAHGLILTYDPTRRAFDTPPRVISELVTGEGQGGEASLVRSIGCVPLNPLSDELQFQFWGPYGTFYSGSDALGVFSSHDVEGTTLPDGLSERLAPGGAAPDTL